MVVRYVAIVALAATQFLLTVPPPAKAVSREEIRQMPIVQRPSRPGHFYGNAVRRSAGRRHSPNS